MSTISELEKTCDHDGCKCVVKANSMVVRGNNAYCSIGCRYEEGCTHATCNCSDPAGHTKADTRKT